MEKGIDESGNNDRNQNEPLEYLEGRFNYPLPINDRGTCFKEREYILEYFGGLLSFR